MVSDDMVERSPQREQVETGVLEELRREVRRYSASDGAGGEVDGQSSSLTSSGLRDLVAQMEARWSIGELAFTSNIPVIGPLIAKFRDLWNGISTKWYVRYAVQQQVDFNASVVRATQHLEGAVHLLEQELHWLEEMASGSDRVVTGLNTKLGAVELNLRMVSKEIEGLKREALEDRVARLERWVRDARSQGAPGGPGAGLTLSLSGAPLAIDNYTFSNRFRGSSDALREAQRHYVDLFLEQGPVLDLGCGRGEFLELLKEAGVPATGVESDMDMVEHCRALGLDVKGADALEHLASLSDDSLGGVFMAQFVEHLPPTNLLELINLCHRKLRPGGVLLAETNNPSCLLAMTTHFIIDLTHQRPLHPELMKFLLEAAGFGEVSIHYSSLVPEELRLEPISSGPWDGPLEEWRASSNRNVEKLNQILYGYQDYAVVAKKA